MKLPITVCLLLWPCTASALDRSELPSKSAAASAYFAYEENICQALIDVCDGIAAISPEAIEKLVCRQEQQVSAVCTFWYADKACLARFVRSEGAAGGWVVAFRNRAPKGSDVDCK